MKRIFPVIFLSILFFLPISCKKSTNGKITDNEFEECDIKDPLEVQIRDTVFYYTKLFSLWQEYMPPRKVDDILDPDVVQRHARKFCSGEEVLDFMMGLTPLFEGKPVDRYSFLDRTQEVSDEIQKGVASSYGLYLFYLSSDGQDADLHVRMVDKGSPAYLAGIRRGARIYSMNGKTNLGYSQQLSKNFKDVNEALSSENLDIEFQNPEESKKEVDIQNTRFDLDPLLADTVYTIDNHKIGYFAYNSFINVGVPGNRNAFYNQLEAMFTQFENEHINELIVDLRYNGGGSVLTAEYLANRLVPTSAAGGLMYENKVNAVLEDWGWTEPGDVFPPVYFTPEGNLDLSRIYFLVSDNTASASELLINVLKPYMDVKMVGVYGGADASNNPVPKNTYGKPVGFFGYPIVNEDIELYVTSFQMLNKNKEGDYFGGLVPDDHAFESFFKDFGDPEEQLIEAALNHISLGDFTPMAMRKRAGLQPLQRDKSISLKDFGKDDRRNNMYKFFTERKL